MPTTRPEDGGFVCVKHRLGDWLAAPPQEETP